jgi:transcriptional regulator with XRE-family HTH domain
MLGEKIRRLRKEKNLSLRSLARDVGVTASFLSQVERELADPSLGTLRKIAEILEVPVFELLLEDEPTSPVVRKDKRVQIQVKGTPAVLELLVPNLKQKMELMLCRTRAHDGKLNYNTPLPHPTEECIYVVQGKMEIELSQETYTLDEGDSIYFKGVLLESLRAIGDEELVFISAITPPTF